MYLGLFLPEVRPFKLQYTKYLEAASCLFVGKNLLVTHGGNWDCHDNPLHTCLGGYRGEFSRLCDNMEK